MIDAEHRHRALGNLISIVVISLAWSIGLRCRSTFRLRREILRRDQRDEFESLLFKMRIVSVNTDDTGNHEEDQFRRSRKEKKRPPPLKNKPLDLVTLI